MSRRDEKDELRRLGEEVSTAESLFHILMYVGVIRNWYPAQQLSNYKTRDMTELFPTVYHKWQIITPDSYIGGRLFYV